MWRVLVVFVCCVSAALPAKHLPKWKKQACELPAVQSEHSHYICDDKGEPKCLPGWQGDLCDVPICKKGCDPLQGYCKRPGECRCKLGFYGERCNKCIPLPGCQHGYCNESFECICRDGWDGLFCSEQASASLPANVAASWAGLVKPVAPASSCRAVNMGTVISPWSASVCQGILDCCVKLLSVHPDVIMNAATVDAPANVAVKWGGLVSSVPSATGILAACTAPATSPGSASVSPDGEACFVMKNSTIVKRTQILARTAENVFP